MSTITWLHLSDFHFHTDRVYDSSVVLDALLVDVAERIKTDNLGPDFIVISGDIAFASRPEEYNLARQFLDKLLETINLSKDRLFLVPGNHDVDRSAIELPADVPDTPDDRESVARLLDSAHNRALVFRRFHNYQTFINEYLEGILSFDSDNYFYTRFIEVRNLQVAILGLNSGWLSTPQADRNRLVLSERQVRPALATSRDADLRLAVMHHPFDWLADFDRDDVEALLCNHCDYVLRGHKHRVGLLQAHTPDSRAMIIATGACYKARQYLNSYNFVRLDLVAGTGTVYLRMYSDRGGGFWTKDVRSYRNVDDGVYSFSLPDRFYSWTGERDERLRISRPSSPGIVSLPTSESNPFIYGRPVRPDEFVGREGELRTVFNRLRNGESTAVVGEPHIGKTSLLLKLADEETRWAYLGDAARRLFVSLIDLHSIGDDCTPVDFWTEALEPLGKQPGCVSMTRWQQAVESSYARRPLLRLMNHLGRAGRRVVLLLDEFERLLIHPNFQEPAFFALLRSLATHTDGLAVVIASRSSVAEMNQQGRGLLNEGSPLFNNLIDLTLNPFDERSVALLLDRAGDALSSEDRLLARRVAGRHPFLLQAIAAALVEEVGEQDRQVRAVTRFYERISFHFDDLWHSLDDSTRATAVILSLMELGGRALGRDFAYGEIEQINTFGPELRKLQERGLAERVKDSWRFDWEHLLLWRGERWTVGAQAFAWWVRDVVVTASRRVPTYDEWLANKRYRLLLTQGQWERLMGTVRSAHLGALHGVETLARSLFEELGRR